MYRAIISAIAAGLLVAAATPALAGPMLTWVDEDCGENTCYEFSVVADPLDTEPASFYIRATFRVTVDGVASSFVQSLAFGSVQVDDDENATNYENLQGVGSGYSKDADTFFYLSKWSPSPPYDGVIGGEVGAPLLQFSAGTGTTVYYTEVELAHLVVPNGAIIRWGSEVEDEPGYDDHIGRRGERFKIIGQVPEPGTAILVALGLTGLVIFDRRLSVNR